MADAMHDLCRILDERGAEYKTVLYHVEVGDNALIVESKLGTFTVVMNGLDARQAVNAVLGPKDNARDQLIYALNECRQYACLCEHCPHRVGSFEADPQTIQCRFDFDKLMHDAGVGE